MKYEIKGNYDRDYLSTPEYSEPEIKYFTCDNCGEVFTADDIIKDKDKQGEETGWYYCLACFSLKI